jgi:hypothetical protein
MLTVVQQLRKYFELLWYQNRGDGLQTSKVPEHARTACNRWSPNLGLGVGSNTLHRKKLASY